MKIAYTLIVPGIIIFALWLLIWVSGPERRQATFSFELSRCKIGNVCTVQGYEFFTVKEATK